MTSENIYKEDFFSNYETKETIGKGTFSIVKLGINRKTKEKVAIKILEKKKILNKDDLERVEREIEILENFKNINIVKINEIYQTKEKHYFIMEYCENGELFNHIVKKQRLSDREASYFYYQLINGLEYIHSKNVVHRDLKPENLLLGKGNVLKIIDFGLSNYFNGKKLLSTPCGSPCYASPEMVSGKKYNGFKIDVWSSGIILYAMVCGYLPFEDKNNDILFKKIAKCELDYPKVISKNAKRLLKKIIINDPEKRITIQEIKKEPFYLQGKEAFKDRHPELFVEDDIERLHYNYNTVENTHRHNNNINNINNIDKENDIQNNGRSNPHHHNPADIGALTIEDLNDDNNNRNSINNEENNNIRNSINNDENEKNNNKSNNNQMNNDQNDNNRINDNESNTIQEYSKRSKNMSFNTKKTNSLDKGNKSNQEKRKNNINIEKKNIMSPNLRNSAIIVGKKSIMSPEKRSNNISMEKKHIMNSDKRSNNQSIDKRCNTINIEKRSTNASIERKNNNISSETKYNTINTEKKSNFSPEKKNKKYSSSGKHNSHVNKIEKEKTPHIMQLVKKEKDIDSKKEYKTLNIEINNKAQEPSIKNTFRSNLTQSTKTSSNDTLNNNTRSISQKNKGISNLSKSINNANITNNIKNKEINNSPHLDTHQKKIFELKKSIEEINQKNTLLKNNNDKNKKTQRPNSVNSISIKIQNEKKQNSNHLNFKNQNIRITTEEEIINKEHNKYKHILSTSNNNNNNNNNYYQTTRGKSASIINNNNNKIDSNNIYGKSYRQTYDYSNIINKYANLNSQPLSNLSKNIEHTSYKTDNDISKYIKNSKNTIDYKSNINSKNFSLSNSSIENHNKNLNTFNTSARLNNNINSNKKSNDIYKTKITSSNNYNHYLTTINTPRFNSSINKKSYNNPVNKYYNNNDYNIKNSNNGKNYNFDFLNNNKSITKGVNPSTNFNLKSSNNYYLNSPSYLNTEGKYLKYNDLMQSIGSNRNKGNFNSNINYLQTTNNYSNNLLGSNKIYY